MADTHLTLTIDQVRHVATLAYLVLTDEQLETFRVQISSVLDYVSKIQQLDTDHVVETSQVTGLENVFREDMVDEKTMLSQDEALSQAKKTHNGYFVVPAVFEN